MEDVGDVRVLVVDDSQPVRDTIRTMLEMLPGCLVVGEAADGPGAIAEARRTKPDIVLMDINLPGCDGLAATEQILAEVATRIIVVSVENGREYFRRALQVGACNFLVKPFSAESLADAIKRAVAPGGTTAAEADPEPLILVGAQGGVGVSSLAVHMAARIGQDRRVALAAWGEGQANLDLLVGERHAVPVLPCQDEGIAKLAAAWDVLVVDGGRMPAHRLPPGGHLLVVLDPSVPALHGASAYAHAGVGTPRFVLNRAGCAGGLSREQVARGLGAEPFAVLPEDAAVRRAVNLGTVADLGQSPWRAATGTLLDALGLSVEEPKAAGPRVRWLSARSPAPAGEGGRAHGA